MADADIPQSIKDLVKEIANEKDYVNGDIKLQATSSKGSNYTSKLFLASISAPPKEDLKLFAKVMHISETQRDPNHLFKLYFKTERFFYVDLAVTFEKLYNKHGVLEKDRLIVPKLYGYKFTELEETLIFEDLVAKGYQSFDRMKTFDRDYAFKSVEQLAKFHALGLTYKEENPEEFHGTCRKNMVDMFADSKMMGNILEMGTNTGTQVVKEEYRSKIQKYLEANKLQDAMKKLWKQSADGFLTHGDYRHSNIMYRSQNGEVEVVPLDYQQLHFGTLAADLMYFIWTGSDAEFRKNHYDKLLEHYYSELTRALLNLHVDIKKVYPQNVFEQELEDTKSIGLFIGLGMMTVLTVDPENAPKMEEGEPFEVKPNQIGLDRINGIIDDYIRWGII